MHQEYLEKIQTFSLGYAEKYYDESKQSKEIAKYIGTDHHTVIFNQKDAMDIVYKLPDIYCEPFSDSSQIPTYYLSKFVSKK